MSDINYKEYLESVRNAPNSPAHYKYMSDQLLESTLARGGALPDEYNYNLSQNKSESDTSHLDGKNDLTALERWADLWVSEDSPDWMKASYNRSLTGLTEKMIKGTARYNVDETDFTILEDIGASLMSFFMPLDIITMKVGTVAGKALSGKLGQQLVKKKAYKKFGKKLTDKALKTGESLPDNWIPNLNKIDKALMGAAGNAPTLALYEAAIGGVQSKIEGNNPMDGVVHGLWHGAALGAITGGIGGGMGAKAAEILKAGKKNPLGKGDWLKARLGYGIPGQVTAESTVFTASEMADRINAGEDVAGKDFLKAWARNIGMFGALKTYGFGKQKAAEKAAETPLGKAIKEHTKAWRDEIRKGYEKEGNKTTESLENVKKNLEDYNVDTKEVQSEINRSLGSAKEVDKMLTNLGKSLDKVDKIIESGDPKKIEGSGKTIAEAVQTIKLAEEVLRQGEKGEISGVEFNVTQQQKKSIKSLREKLNKIEKDFDTSFESLNAQTPAEGPSPVLSKPRADVVSKKKLKEMSVDKDGSSIVDLNGIDPKTGKKYDLNNPEVRNTLATQIEAYNIRKKGEIDPGLRKMSPELKKKSAFKEGDTVEFETVSKDGKKIKSAGSIEDLVMGAGDTPMAYVSGVKEPIALSGLNKPITTAQVKRAQKKLEEARQKKEAQVEYMKEVESYKNLKKNLEKDIGKVKSDKVLDKVVEHTTKVLEGKEKIDSVPKEVSNHVVSILKQLGTSKDKAVIDKGIKMFAKDIKRKDYKTDAEHRAAQENMLIKRMNEFASGKMTDKILISKSKNFAKDFFKRTGEVLDVGTKEDISWIISKRKGDATKIIERSNLHHKLDSKGNQSKETISEKSTANYIANKYENRLKNEMGYSKAEIDAVRDMFGIPKSLFGIQKKGGKGLETASQLSGRASKDLSLTSMREWAKHVESMYKSGKEKLDIKNYAKERNISKLEEQSIVRLLGEGSGDVTKLTPQNREYYKYLIEKHNTGPIERTESFQNTQQAIVELADFPVTRTLAKKLGLPVYYMLRESGIPAGKKLADKFIKFDTTYTNEYKGRGDVFASEIRKKLGKDVKHIWMMDKDMVNMYLKDKNAPALTLAEAKFWKSLNQKGSPAYEAKKVMREMTDFYWKSLAKEAKVLYSPKEYAKFQKEFSSKFVRDYFTRRLTKEAREFLLSSENPEVLLKDLNAAVKKQSEVKALEKYPDKNSKQYKDYVKKLQDPTTAEGKNLRDRAAENLINIVTHQHHLVESNYLKERGPTLPAFLETTRANGQKRLIRTYEHKMEKTIDPYILGMSKYLATLKHFPEYTGLGKKYGLNQAGLDRFNLAIKGNTLAKYTDDAIRKLIGMDGKTKAYESILQDISNVSAAIGLSSPTSGVKNILIGMPRNFAAYGIFNTMAGYAKALSYAAFKKGAEKYTASGALGFTPKTLELGQNTGKFTDWIPMEKLFKGNLMQQTENINRIAAMEAGKMYFSQQLSILKGNHDIFGATGTKNNATRVLKDVYKLSDKDIGLVLKGKLENKADFKRYQEILRNVEHYSHISTQGGTSVGQLPLWMSSKVGRPLTLFQRIAYSTTHDTAINYVKPAMRGNIAPLARATIGHYIGGKSLYTMYKWLFNEEGPESSSDELSKAFFYVNRSEMLGLMGFVYDPYDRGVTSNLMTPVVYRNAQLGAEALYQSITGERNLKQAAHEWARQSVVVYGQYDRWRRNKKSPEWELARKINSRMSQFNDDYAIENSWNKNKTNYYYKDLKEAFYFGSEEDIAKTFFAAYADIMQNSEFPGTTPTKRHKDAIARIKRSVSTLNPMNVSSQTSKGKSVSKKSLYLRWTRNKFGQEGVDELLKSEKQYEYLLRKFYKVINNRDYWNKYGIYGKKFST
jgi:hypothetical protein